MRCTVPIFSERAELLFALLKGAYKTVSKRTKRAIKDLNLQDFGWNQRHSCQLDDVQEQLRNVVNSAHCDPALHVRMHSDVSDELWDSAASKCEQNESTKPITEQSHN